MMKTMEQKFDELFRKFAELDKELDKMLKKVL
jgi:hypothetical protein